MQRMSTRRERMPTQREKKIDSGITKAEAARLKQLAVELERKKGGARKKEDQYSQEAEDTTSRAARRREEKAEKRAEAAARRAEARRLAEGELQWGEYEAAKAELMSHEEESMATIKLKQSRTVAAEEYARMVLVKNTNSGESLIDARSVDEAIKQAKQTMAGVVSPVDRFAATQRKGYSKEAGRELKLFRLRQNCIV